jgi:ribonuclease R
VIRPEQISRIFEQSDHPLGVKEILRAAGLHPGQQTDLKRALRDLVRSGRLQQEGKRFELAGSSASKPAADRKAPSGAKDQGGGKGSLVEGTLHLHRDGFGFVHPAGEAGENVYLPPEQARRALDGDRVRVQVVPGQGGRTQGRLIEVVDRIRQQIVGRYTEQGGNAWVESTDGQVPRVRVPRTQLARDGDLVKVRLGVGHALVPQGQGLFGEVTGSVGKPGEPSAEVLSIAYAKGFSDEFPLDVMEQADHIGVRVTDAEAREPGRVDLRATPLVTIDGEDARDFDDAVFAEPRGSGWRLVVAIADVSHYVHEGRPLDVEALRRATSVYLPDRVLPMLPERLSAGICSLKPEEDRLCVVADMQIDGRGSLGDFKLYPAVMRSAARCTYNEVQDVLEGTDVPHRNAFRLHFLRLRDVARALTRMRQERGSIDFDLPETRIVLDEKDAPVRMEKRERKEAHRLIEECMLAANEAVAKFFQDRRLPTVYRFHDVPDEEKLATFAALAQAHGFKLGGGGKISSHELNAFLEKLEGHPERRALNQLLLRSMMQAVYSAENVGHYGLAAEHYLHFTSPIRRYPDTLVHRLLKAEWARQGHRRGPSEVEAESERLERLAQSCSERERAAMQVEREVVSYYATLLMKDRVGEAFDATVSSVTEFGFFVELDTLFVEGLVKAESLGGASRLDKVLQQLVYASGRKIRVGQSVRVRLVSANTARRQLDFEVLAFEGEAPVESVRDGSAHPGFDRLRALAAKGGKAQAKPATSHRKPKRGKQKRPDKKRRR